MHFPPKALEDVKADNILTETNINYSVKIGKQVLKAKLKEQMAELDKQIIEEGNLAKKVLKTETIEKALRVIFKKEINNDQGFTYFRLGMNNFMSTRYKSNWSLVLADDGLNYAARRIANPAVYDSSYENMIEKKSVLTSFYSKIGVIPKDGNEDSECTNDWSFSITIPPQILKQMDKVNHHLQKAKMLNNLLGDLTHKLNNLDDVMEDLEAKILIRDLESTVNGRQVLDLTSDLISEVLGETLPLTLKQGNE